MNAPARRRRFLLLCAIDDARGYPVPVFIRPSLNRTVVRMAAAIRRQRTARRYRRTDNRAAALESRTVG